LRVLHGKNERSEPLKAPQPATGKSWGHHAACYVPGDSSARMALSISA